MRPENVAGQSRGPSSGVFIFGCVEGDFFKFLYHGKIP